jgi:hypothetical protein
MQAVSQNTLYDSRRFYFSEQSLWLKLAAKAHRSLMQINLLTIPVQQQTPQLPAMQALCFCNAETGAQQCKYQWSRHHLQWQMPHSTPITLLCLTTAWGPMCCAPQLLRHANTLLGTVDIDFFFLFLDYSSLVLLSCGNLTFSAAESFQQ